MSGATDPVAPAFVLCHGFMNDRRLWSRVSDDLAALGPCHFADQRHDAALTDMAARVLADAPAEFVLIGFSMGGFVARAIHDLAPGRVTALVQANTSARGDTPALRKRNVNLITTTREKGFHGLSSAALTKAVHPDSRDDAELIGLLRTMADDMGGDAFINQLSIARADERPTLGRIACPTLVVWSRQDELRSLEEAEELADGIPAARLEIIEDSGHMTPLEAPAAFIGVVRGWLDET